MVGSQLNHCKVSGQNKTDWMNTCQLVAVVLVVLDVIIMHFVLVILDMAVVSLVPLCTLSSLCELSLMLVIIVVLVRSIMHVVLVKLVVPDLSAEGVYTCSKSPKSKTMIPRNSFRPYFLQDN